MLTLSTSLVKKEALYEIFRFDSNKHWIGYVVGHSVGSEINQNTILLFTKMTPKVKLEF